ncbi:hypothetical protein [Sphingobacterium sp. R2]|uniref:hypothetical protein n=1 Tax=Sphingobacterium sp. R2 TaxID=3112958 RepID=UPI00345DD2AE
MEIVSLAILAYTFAKPFIDKTAEGLATKVGEDIWSFIKGPFEQKGKENIEKYAKDNAEEFKKELEHEITSNDLFRTVLQEKIEKAQIELSGNFQQNINSFGSIEKQVNIQNNSGNLSF